MKFLLLAILVTLVSCSTGTGLNPNLERKMDGKTQVK